MIFYDFEVFKYDWLAVFIDTITHQKHVIVNDRDALIELYQRNIKNLWVGFNIKHYDQYIFKAIMLGLNPKEVNDKIIGEDIQGWTICREFSNIPMTMYDVFANKSYGLKTLEGFMGNNIKETSVPFDLDRKLTQKEIDETIGYCTSDVENTISVFMERINQFNAMRGILDAFPEITSAQDIGESAARITAKVLGCKRQSFDDEFDFFFLPCLEIKKYSKVLDWFESLRHNQENLPPCVYYKQSFTLDVAGMPHVFGFGGLHGAPSEPIHASGALYHVDVNNYYPSLLIAHGLVSRAATNDNYKKIYSIRKELKMKQLAAETRQEAKKYKVMQDPYKVMLNGLSGAMKDKANPAYDPRNNNIMCINGQLMLLDLIEHLEVIPGFKLIQSNTDGLIVQIPDTDEAFEMLDDVCYEWEKRCSTSECDIGLATDQLIEIYQKDVNNYLWIDGDGGVERRGAYVKELSRLDNDLPIVNKAVVDYMVNKTPISETVNNCNELIMFQKIVKLSSKYEYVEHNGKRYDYKCYRVFASKDNNDGKILKCRSTNNPAKFGNTPDKCFIENGDVNVLAIPDKLDKQWYIDLANKRLQDFGII